LPPKLASQFCHLYYFASSRNGASRDLHAPFGFTEIERNISVSGCTFEDGIGILYHELPLNRRH
jgi:hypothetical protein